jgi:hypothetical protein
VIPEFQIISGKLASVCFLNNFDVGIRGYVGSANIAAAACLGRETESNPADLHLVLFF